MKYFWRFASGLHLDGQRRMNNSWRRNGTMPRHVDNWWNRKSRLRKMGWRWGIIAVIIVEIWFLVAFLIPALIVTGAVLLYLAEKAVRRIASLVSTNSTVRVAVEGARATDERAIVDNIGAVTYESESAPQPANLKPLPEKGNKQQGAGVINNNPFLAVKPIRKDEAG